MPPTAWIPKQSSVEPGAHWKADDVLTDLEQGSRTEASRHGGSSVCPVFSRLFISFLQLKAGALTAAPSPNPISGLPRTIRICVNTEFSPLQWQLRFGTQQQVAFQPGPRAFSHANRFTHRLWTQLSLQPQSRKEVGSYSIIFNSFSISPLSVCPSIHFPSFLPFLLPSCSICIIHVYGQKLKLRAEKKEIVGHPRPARRRQSRQTRSLFPG